MVSDVVRVLAAARRLCLNPCSNGIWSLTLGTGYGSRAYRLNPCSNGIWSLTETSLCKYTEKRLVLILVLMEYGLWHGIMGVVDLVAECLNPCSNGIWSLTSRAYSWDCSDSSLNPCSNGIWSLTFELGTWCCIDIGLNPCSNGIWSLTCREEGNPQDDRVLILVLMEYGLWPKYEKEEDESTSCLNPCSNGIWSLTQH